MTSHTPVVFYSVVSKTSELNRALFLGMVSLTVCYWQNILALVEHYLPLQIMLDRGRLHLYPQILD